MSRTLTPAIDEFKTDGMTLRVYTPHPAIPDGGSREALSFALLPAVIIELTVDNTQSDTPAYGFLGLAIKTGRLRTVDVSTDKALCGVGFGTHWAFVARPETNGVYLIRDGSIADAVEKGAPRLLHKGREGGVALAVPPRSEKTLTMAFGFYREGNVTVGIESRYAYTEYFKNVDEVCDYALRHADEIKRSCAEFDAETKEACPEPLRRELFAQALRAYYANAQLTVSNEGRLHYNVPEGGFYWRNTMDLAADHLGWELWRNPWVVRNIMDLYIERYSYHDRVRFDEKDASGNNVATFHPGGELCS